MIYFPFFSEDMTAYLDNTYFNVSNRCLKKDSWLETKPWGILIIKAHICVLFFNILTTSFKYENKNRFSLQLVYLVGSPMQMTWRFQIAVNPTSLSLYERYHSFIILTFMGKIYSEQSGWRWQSANIIMV